MKKWPGILVPHNSMIMANGLQVVSELILFLIIIIYYDYQFHYYYAMAMGRHLSNAADTATPLFICLSFPLNCAIKIKIQKVFYQLKPNFECLFFQRPKFPISSPVFLWWTKRDVSSGLYTAVSLVRAGRSPF